MSTSNLKTSIAALSLCVSAVAIYIHLPYVIAAVSGSGEIEAVPLAIFAVSAIVALVSVIYLIRLAVSRAGDKKKIDLSGEESGHTASQVPQEKSVKQDSRSQTDVARAISQNNNASSPSPSVGPPPPPPPPPSLNGANQKGPMSALLAQAKGGRKLKRVEVQHESKGESSKSEQPQGLSDELEATLSNDKQEEYYARVNRFLQEEKKKKKGYDADLLTVIEKNRKLMVYSNSESERSSYNNNSDWASNEDEDKQKEQEKKVRTKHKRKSTSSTLQSDNNKRSESSDSDYESDDNVKSEPTPPSHSVPKAKPSLLPKPKNKPAASQVNNADPVNSEVQDPSTSSIKDCRKFFDQ